MKNKNWARSFQSSKGAYASNSNEWVSYNDVQFVKEKAEYVLSNKFGGVAVFTMDMDDFNNDCCQVRFFLDMVLQLLGKRGLKPPWARGLNH